MSDCPDYEAIKALAAALRRPASTLIALSDTRDPFYITPARLAGAEWLADLWALLDPPDGVHLRRLHYQLVSLPDARKLDGSRYENTERDWSILSSASVDARALGLIDAAKFTDRRAGEPVFVADDSGQDTDASIVCHGADVDAPPAEALFALEYEPQPYEFPPLPNAYVSPPRLAEPFALEIWAEKSTMNDILEPLARRRNVTLIAGVGELSQIHCAWHVHRALGHRKKARILYISDFDPSGARMPISVARKIEHILRRDDHDLDIRLDPIVLTSEQVARYALPRIPIKDSDRSKRDFEDRFGEGAVELDALEALHPGELARIVAGEIDFYRDPTRTATRENSATAREAWDAVGLARAEVLDQFESEIAALRADFETMQAEIAADQQALTAIAEDAAALSRPHVEAINARTVAFYERAGDLMARIGAELEDSVPDADDFAWVAPEAPDDDEESLFDSQRGYVDQIDRYKQHLGKPTRRRGDNGGEP